MASSTLCLPRSAGGKGWSLLCHLSSPPHCPSLRSGPGGWCQSSPGKSPSSGHHSLLCTLCGFCTRVSWASDCPRPHPATRFQTSQPMWSPALLSVLRPAWHCPPAGTGVSVVPRVSCLQEPQVVWGGVRALPRLQDSLAEHLQTLSSNTLFF